jgi:hypothetical protein
MTHTDMKIMDKLNKINKEIKAISSAKLKNLAYEELIKLVIQNIHPENPILLNIKVRLAEIKEM